MTALKALILSLGLALSFAAAAQRTPMPIVDFKDVPLTGATGPLSAAQVKQALTAAAQAAQWEITSAADGQLEARFVKGGGKHTIEVTIPYSVGKYSVLYKSSDNMKYSPESAPWGFTQMAFENDVRKQRARFVQSPESAYGVARPAGLVHPFYETWVHNLMDATRRYAVLQAH